MKTIAILACKLLRFAGKLLGKGSSLPGSVALKLDPDILQKIKLPDRVIAVTGSNGKTSTVEMIAHVLRQNGWKVAYNREGSNQIEGVTTFLLSDCTLGGTCRSDVILLESDERFARHTFRHFTPTHYVITNLYRDQLTRNGHPEWIFDILQDSIHPGTRLILNADDPLVSCFALGRDNPVTWFGVERLPFSETQPSGRYRDGAYCPHCKHPMEYEYYHYNHIGAYRCTKCGHAKPATDYTATAADLENGTLTIDGTVTIQLAFRSIYNVYNILAAYAACRECGTAPERIAGVINNYILKNGRMQKFTLGAHHGTLLTSKHENSIAYDTNLRYVASTKADCTVLIIVDAVSRKYFTSETSWLWDIDFDLLNCPHVGKIVLSGRYCNDLAMRFSFSSIPQERLEVIPEIPAAAQALQESGDEALYVVTCFSDRDKLLDLPAVKKEA